MRELNFIKFLESSEVMDFLRIFNSPKTISSFSKMTTALKFDVFFLEKSHGVPVYCFPIWASNTRKHFIKDIPGIIRCVCCIIIRVRRGLENLWLIFSILQFICIQNNWLDFLHQDHNWQFSTRRISVFIEVLRFKYLASETWMNSVEEFLGR